ncbi:MAG: zf-HC2 domain-containing protein [Sandaracinaceae bacterium]|jgi:anti-sigma factor RsiW|nr:zf-HC2 domain-containing protein [Sandaracinaceae bacterium]
MNCDQARPHLTALAHGTLSDALAEEVSEHLATCAVCRERAEALSAEFADARDNEAKPLTWTSKLRSIPRRILGPQVSMAMVLLLMVGIGLLYLPRLRGNADLSGSPLVDTGDTTGLRGAISPAAPLELALDPRAHRIRTREEEEALAAAAAIAARALASRDAGVTPDGSVVADASSGTDAGVVLEPPSAPPAPTPLVEGAVPTTTMPAVSDGPAAPSASTPSTTPSPPAAP